jgi:hypothetical protein
MDHLLLIFVPKGVVTGPLLLLQVMKWRLVPVVRVALGIPVDPFKFKFNTVPAALAAKGGTLSSCRDRLMDGIGIIAMSLTSYFTECYGYNSCLVWFVIRICECIMVGRRLMPPPMNE